MTIDDARARVARGAALLDERHPGWEDKIDCAKLNIQSDCRCVLGQLEGSYILAVQRWGMLSATAEAHGFTHRSTLGSSARGNFSLLTQAWRELLAVRVPPVVTWTHRERTTERPQQPVGGR